ncbi:MAG: hypothetical protein E7388_01045 [Ruminococcaceae bacterium]|nr:hypothetical protein [Oscillospiraceae bacterium]
MEKIYLRDHGILPGNDCTLALVNLFNTYKEDTEFIFDEGKYYFTHKIFKDIPLSNTDVIPERVLGVLLENMKNIRLTGNNTWLMYEGMMQAVTMLHCENIVMDGFTIDWEKPLISEGVIVGKDENTIDIYINPEVFPHRIREGQIEFDLGADQWVGIGVTWECAIEFDFNNRAIRKNTGDSVYLISLNEDLGNNVYRFNYNNSDVKIGNILAIRHNFRRHAGIFTEKCKNITIENVNVHSCNGLGCLAQFCEDLTYRKVNFIPNRKAGREVVNGRDDGMHITCCKGTVTITECSFVGLMDDPINVHGCCVNGVEWVDEYTVICKFVHDQACGFAYWAEDGDEIVFINRKNMSPLGTAISCKYTLIDKTTFEVKFTEPVSDEIRGINTEDIALDNLTHTASFVCSKNRFGSCRARGVLVSTPKPVKIINNVFQSSGSAILVAGDSNYWYESGECHDVEISGNMFYDSCLSSYYGFCEGIISVCPVVPEPEIDKPFHKNIRIHDNTFDTPDTPLLYSLSCDGLEFKNNRIFKSPSTDKWHPGTHFFNLNYCKNVEINNNDFIGVFNLEMIKSENCKNVKVN